MSTRMEIQKYSSSQPSLGSQMPEQQEEFPRGAAAPYRSGTGDAYQDVGNGGPPYIPVTTFQPTQMTLVMWYGLYSIASCM